MDDVLKLRLSKYNVVVIDCSNITSQIRESVEGFMLHTPSEANVIFTCLHGYLSVPVNSKIKLCNSGVLIGSLQEVIDGLLTYNTEYVHVVTANVVCVNIIYVKSLQSFQNLTFWTPSTSYDGGIYDIRRKHWWGPNMRVYWVNHFVKYWKGFDKDVPELTEKTMISAMSSFLGGIERFVPSVMM